MEDNKVSNWISGIIIGSITILVISFIFYYLLHDWKGCDLTTKLGTFGDFIGGTTGPLLSTMAIFGALIAVHLSTTELKLQRIESNKSDIFQIISVIHLECITLLECDKRYKDDLLSQDEPVIPFLNQV